MSGPRLFGTDGIRAPFGQYPLDRDTVTRLGLSLATLLGGRRRQPSVLLGGDTRASTPTLARWLTTGLGAGGASVRYAGIVPTPGVACLARETGAEAGVAISASHNPAADNGIKLIGPDGFKWPLEREHQLEERLFGTEQPQQPPSDDPEPEPALVDGYLGTLTRTLPGDTPLAGLSIVLDSGHGAASGLARRLFERLGAEVTALGDRPDGTNINLDCGSTQPGRMAEATRRAGADLGIAFDGDADRALFADESGTVRDGDAVLYLWALDLLRREELKPPRIVATTMSNLGLQLALEREGIELVRCDVGDRVVVETMRREGILLGGEQSGHIVHLGLATTGDGLLTGLQVAYTIRRAGEPLSRLLSGFRRYPQVLKNVTVGSKPDLASLPRVAEITRAVEERLGRRGRLVLRYSGTEPLARVMIEGPDQVEIENLADRLAESIRAEIGA